MQARKSRVQDLEGQHARHQEKISRLKRELQDEENARADKQRELTGAHSAVKEAEAASRAVSDELNAFLDSRPRKKRVVDTNG